MRRSRRRCSAASTTSTGADVAIATEWRTAFPVRDLPGCREKVYLVQDDEPQFYATSSRVDLGRGDATGWATAASPTRRGWRTSCATGTGSRRAGSSAAPTWTCTRSPASEGREPGPGRGLRAARDRAARRRARARRARHGRSSAGPTSAWSLFGSSLRVERAVRRRGPRRAAAAPSWPSSTARRASGIVFSLTTHSLVAHEMMATGLPGGRARGRQRGSRARRVRASSSSSPSARPTRSPTRSSGCSTTASTPRRWRARARGVRRGAHLGARRRPGRGGAARLPVAPAPVRRRRRSSGRRPGGRRRLTRAGAPPSGGPR